jgi:hypothetical protein
MADNSTETSNTNFSINDGIASLLQDPTEENQAVDEAQPDEAEMVEAGDPEVEADDTEGDEAEAVEAEAEDADDQEAEDETDDASEDEAEDDADQEPELYTVKVDGEEIEVDLDTLKSGFMMQSAFTKRTQALAEERKVLEGEMQNAREARDTYLQNAQQIAQILQAQTQQEPDWARLREELDPKEYADAIYLHQQRKEQLANTNADIDRINAERAKEAQYNFGKHMESEKQLMLDAIPEWQDDKVRNDERVQVIEYAKTFGYTEQEIALAADHRAIKALRDSWLLSKLNNKAVIAKKKVKAAPKVAKAGIPKTKAETVSRKRRDLRNRFDKERSMSAAIELLQNQS